METVVANIWQKSKLLSQRIIDWRIGIAITDTGILCTECHQ